MIRILTIALLLLLNASAAPTTRGRPWPKKAPELTVAELGTHFRQNPDMPRLHVILTGQAIYCEGRTVTLKDSSGYLTLHRFSTTEATPLKAGDTVRLLVCLKRQPPPSTTPYIYFSRFQVLQHGEPPPVPVVSPEDIAAGRYNSRPVTLEGTVVAAIPDDIDARWRMLSVEADGHRTLVMLNAPEMTADELNALVGARISATGFCFARHASTRFIPDPHLSVARDNLRILAPPADPFDAETFRPFADVFEPADGRTRHQRATGVVLAAWDDDSILLRTDENARIEARLKRNAVLPPVGARVTVAGQLRRNAFFTTLYQADIRPEASQPSPPDAVTATSAQQILHDLYGQDGFNAGLNGHLVEIRGKVFDIQQGGYTRNRMDVLADGVHVPVVIGPGVTPPEPGSHVRVTGICRFLTETELDPMELTRLTGFMVIPRSAADIVVTAAPPWWTPGRLLIVIGSLLGLLVAILAWNAALRRLAERRGRQLFDEQVAHISSDLRVDERSRLAIELHDSISQNLTAASFQIDTAGRLLAKSREATERHLSIAAKTISSCREELRNCIWDLRSQTLEDADMESAIRKTLASHLGAAQLAVRFAVPRARLTDNTAHTLLSILRELTANAVRHGQATSVKIAGALEGGKLLFSVTDNGSGFDADRAPGVAEGHFGLQGIRERIKRFGGELTVESAAGQGTRVAISIRIPDAKQEAADG